MIVALDQVTQGQACTVLTARQWIDNDEPLLIFNADTYCPTTIAAAARRFGPQTAGILDLFAAPGDKWSFARLGADDRVLETAEKRRISDWASTGLYYFRRGSDFVRHAQAMIDANDRSGNEFYVAPIYNRLIAAGEDVRGNRVDEVWVFGHATGSGSIRAGVSTVTTRRPRHVLHVLNSAGGGAALSTIGLIESLRERGIESSAVCHDAGSPSEREQLHAATRGKLLFTPCTGGTTRFASRLGNAR